MNEAHGTVAVEVSDAQPQRLHMSFPIGPGITCLLIMLFFVSPGFVRAADDWNVLPASTDDPVPGRLYKWLRGQAQVQFDQRRQAVAALKTPDDVRQRQQRLRVTVHGPILVFSGSR